MKKVFVKSDVRVHLTTTQTFNLSFLSYYAMILKSSITSWISAGQDIIKDVASMLVVSTCTPAGLSFKMLLLVYLLNPF